LGVHVIDGKFGHGVGRLDRDDLNHRGFILAGRKSEEQEY
jgi:hypothetical protein